MLLTGCAVCVFLSAPQLDLVKTTHRSIYGLKTNVYYKVRVRCKMLGGKEFGGFSDLVYVHIPSTGKTALDPLHTGSIKVLF